MYRLPFRKRVENMTYVGAVAQLFDIPLDLIYEVLLTNFKGKEKPAMMNHDVVKLAYDWTAENIDKSDPYRFERMEGTQGKIMMTGNDAGRLGRNIRRRQRGRLVPDHAINQFCRWHHRLPSFAAERGQGKHHRGRAGGR